MKAIINGIEVVGTPKEIFEYKNLVSNQRLRESHIQIPTNEEESKRLMKELNKVINDLNSRTGTSQLDNISNDLFG